MVKKLIFISAAIFSLINTFLTSANVISDLNPVGPLCYCEGLCPNDEHNGTCQAQFNAQCFSSVEEVYDPATKSLVPERSFGCLPPDENGYMQCKGNLVPHAIPKAIECCYSHDLCNYELRPMYVPTLVETHAISVDEQLVALVVSITVCLMAFVILAAFFYVRYKKREQRREAYLQSMTAPDSMLIPAGTSIKELTSGSGSGLPKLVQSTIARQIVLSKCVGKGRYGEVWLGWWRDEKVAAKLFSTTEEASWRRETDVYESVLLRHNNILGFIASDIKGTGCWTQMLLITEYHERGSLHDYLSHHVLDSSSMSIMAHSVAAGVSYLHTEIFSTQGKPAIAHRDITSSNIIVRKDGECVIGEFGLAVKYISENNEIDISPNSRIGTLRYMAPEVLDESIAVSHFEAFKWADMYSVGLVFWEIARRTAVNEKALECQLPYFDVVQSDPEYREMYDAVCVKKIRPSIPDKWNEDEALGTLGKIMQELWRENPVGRLSALRTKKKLAHLLNQESPTLDCKLIKAENTTSGKMV